MPALRLPEQAIKTTALNVFPPPNNIASVVKRSCQLFPTLQEHAGILVLHIFLSKLLWFGCFYLSLYVLDWALRHVGNQPYFQSSEYRSVQPSTSSSSAQDRGTRRSPRCCTGPLTSRAVRRRHGKQAASTFCSEGRAVPCQLAAAAASEQTCNSCLLQPSLLRKSCGR